MYRNRYYTYLGRKLLLRHEKKQQQTSKQTVVRLIYTLKGSDNGQNYNYLYDIKWGKNESTDWERARERERERERERGRALKK